MATNAKMAKQVFVPNCFPRDSLEKISDCSEFLGFLLSCVFLEKENITIFQIYLGYESYSQFSAGSDMIS